MLQDHLVQLHRTIKHILDAKLWVPFETYFQSTIMIGYKIDLGPVYTRAAANEQKVKTFRLDGPLK